ncbi:MAG: hypothetical protein IPP46_05515 [Bacteroidetes bacterium]|nr:hypothetical protein [Bacteroidota bacterium]
MNIEVAPGDIIGVLGVRKDASGGDVNSYATSPATSDINGFPVTIQRLGMQFSLSTTSPQDLWTEAAGSISRVFLYYDTVYINVHGRGTVIRLPTEPAQERLLSGITGMDHR